MRKRQTEYLVSILLGGLGGLAFLLLITITMGLTPAGRLPAGWFYLVVGALFFAFGAAIGVATLPFEDEGTSLVKRSLVHFAVTAGIFTAILRIVLELEWRFVPVWLALLGCIYLVVWLGRWVGWYAEMRQLRQALGLEMGPTALRWRETLPYLPVPLLVNGILPVVLSLVDAVDVPVLRALFVPFLLLPVGGFVPAFSLGKRQGICPLYPLVSVLIFLPASLWMYGGQMYPVYWAIALLAPLLGNLLGAAWRRGKEKQPWSGYN